MKYVMLFVVDEDAAPNPDEVAQRMTERVIPWWDEHTRAGRILGGERLAPAATATTVRLTGPTPIVSDGPYLEAKETIGGYALIDVPDLDAALAMARTWPGSSAVELRPVVG